MVMNDHLKFAHLFFCLACLSILLSCREIVPESNDLPRVADPSLHLELIAEQPDIMTPIGLTIDADDHLYFLESHTHTPPKDYPGPAFDRIKKGIDQDGDGAPESWQIFADNISDGMNLSCGPDQTIYLACKDMVLAFRDEDRDGRSEQADTLLRMQAGGEIYDHAGIMGVTCSPDGWLYVSRGNTGGLAWEMTAADGSTLSGYGDGGNVVRLTTGGGRLEEVATGFWNPFDIRFTANGHLMLTDNDPDSRGPNRLIDLAYGGDYGYKSLYGGSGIHPFLAWNGELPGTLPYTAPLGEAPCGMIDAEYTNFGSAYQGQVLAAIWEENSIVRITLPTDDQPAEVAEVLIKGDSTFHPVSFATDRKGVLYFTDWVVRQYPAHQQGRLWRLSGSNTNHKGKVSFVKQADNGTKSQALYRKLEQADLPKLEAALTGKDVAAQSVARKLLSRPENQELVRTWLNGDDNRLKLQALLIQFHHDRAIPAETLQQLLYDEDPAIQRSCLKYIALYTRADLSRTVIDALPKGYISPALFDTYLATVRHLQPDFMEQYRNKSKRIAKQVTRQLPADFLASIVQNGAVAPEIRAAAIPQLDLSETDPALLLHLLKTGDQVIQEALLRLFTRRPSADVGDLILAIAADPQSSPALSSLALLSLSYQSADYCSAVAGLLPGLAPEPGQVALRYLCRCTDDEKVSKVVTDYLSGEHEQAANIWLACGGFPPEAERPTSDESWQNLIHGRGNAQLGKWVFHSRKAQCQNCHRVAEWGSDFGPDLSHIGSSKSVDQLLTAILQPSSEISPEWQGWYITDQEGHTHYGRQIDVGYDDAEILLASGEFVTYDNPRSYGMAPTSLMPEGLEERLSVSEMNDLIAYLVSLK